MRNFVLFTYGHLCKSLASCDWLIELGPIGGPKGGYVIAEGPPSELSRLNTPTAPYLKEILEESK